MDKTVRVDEEVYCKPILRSLALASGHVRYHGGRWAWPHAWATRSPLRLKLLLVAIEWSAPL